MFLRDTVEQKLQGYSRKDTVDYYRKIAATGVESGGAGWHGRVGIERL